MLSNDVYSTDFSTNENTSSGSRYHQLFNVEAEEAVVGAVLTDGAIYSTLDLRSEHFYLRKLQFIWQAFESLYLNNKPIDMVTVVDELSKNGHLNEVGGLAYITKLCVAAPTFLNAPEYAEIVKRHYTRRKWQEIGKKITVLAYNKSADLEQEAPDVINMLSSVVQAPGGAIHVKTLADSVLKDIEERRSNPKSVWGVPTGFADYDRVTGGLHPGELVILSGRPGVGKSVIAMQMAYHMASRGHPGAVYSLEMNASMLLTRMISAYSRVPSRHIKSGISSDEEFEDIVNVTKHISQLPLYISDSPDWTTAGLRSDLARLKALHHIEWFILDYAYLLRDGKGEMTETEYTGMVSARCKAICRSLDIAGVVIQSLRKLGMDGTPEAYDLRGSGQQAHDADVILFVVPIDEKDKSQGVKCVFAKGRELELPNASFDLMWLSGLAKLGSISYSNVGDTSDTQQ